MDCILYQIFKIILKNLGENINNPLVTKYVNKIKNKITFKAKNGPSLENNEIACKSSK